MNLTEIKNIPEQLLDTHLRKELFFMGKERKELQKQVKKWIDAAEIVF